MKGMKKTMVSKTHAKSRRDIKTKLMAAIAMLLVSSIMMVSSTYAWFTLSTAPEVTGITTAVGANGNLEMALLPTDGQTTSITNAVGDSYSANGSHKKSNVTWGNLVDLSQEYGLDKITLFPSAINVDGSTLQTTMLKTPTYGSDGRVAELSANTVTGSYNSTSQSFYPNSEYGVRAVGIASGMTDRQLDYRNARSAANTAAAQAKTLAAQALNNNGSALANIAIEFGMGADTASFDNADVVALRTLINALNGNGGALKKIETAYMQYILAFAASAANTAGDTVWSAVKGAVEAENATLDSVVAVIGESNIPEAVKNGIDSYKGAVADVADAHAALQTLEAELATNPDATFTWDEIRTAMTPLANPASIQVNGIPAGEVKEKLGDLVSSVTAQGGLKVILVSGAGVFADIADQCGDYNASVTIEKVEYTGIVLNNMTARMETKSNQTTPILTAIGTLAEGAGEPASGEQGSMPVTEFYGYVIDLAFRTNAAESNLLLQRDAIDRIYGEDNTNEETMGHGSSMTFQATTPDFDASQVKSLMGCIRIVFFNPKAPANNIIATAKLDVTNATLEADGWNAEIILDKPEGTAEDERDVIMSLTQNTATALSVLVYLDGENITNASVAATAATSMTGKMNLQFASSATLVPMEYASLHTPVAKEYEKVADDAQFDATQTYYTRTATETDNYTAVENVEVGTTDVSSYYTTTDGTTYTQASGTAEDGVTYYNKTTTTKYSYTEANVTVDTFATQKANLYILK